MTGRFTWEGWQDGETDCWPPEPDKRWLTVRDGDGEEYAVIVQRRTRNAAYDEAQAQEREDRAARIVLALNEEADARRIVFTFKDDFAELLTAEGVDPATVTDEEWRTFEKMFMDGIGWAEVAETAAWQIQFNRENA